MPDIDQLKLEPAWLKEVLRLWRRCSPRVLVVTDSLSFDPGDGFGLTRLVEALGTYLPTPAVTTRVHGGGFTFDASVTTAAYDQIWLLGANGPALTPAEIGVLTDFMEAGGGIFATGDHASLGLSLCGSLPRVRGMREWSAIPMVVERIDTVTGPGVNTTMEFEDQSDTIPQRIFPVFQGSPGAYLPHPLLRASRVIDVLPDHPHESVCYGGASTLHQGDFPTLPSGARPLPQIVAYAVSTGREVAGKPPTTPKLFGVVSAYDGQVLGQGRVVTDSTWHHFVNINLDGTGSGRLGLRHPDGTFTADYHQVARYYRNILDWLIPANRRWCRWWLDLVLERYRYPLFEEFEPLPHPCPWEPRVDLGRRVVAALENRHGPGAAWELVSDLVDRAELDGLARIVEPGDPSDALKALRLVDPEVIRAGIVGSVADAVLRDLPDVSDMLVESLGRYDVEGVVKAATEATRAAFDAARESYREAIVEVERLFG